MLGECRVHLLKRGRAGVGRDLVCAVLRQNPDGCVGGDENAALVGAVFAQKERKKGGLSAPVRSNDAKAVVRLERK